jgi:hypothetical protein
VGFADGFPTQLKFGNVRFSPTEYDEYTQSSHHALHSIKYVLKFHVHYKTAVGKLNKLLRKLVRSLYTTRKALPFHNALCYSNRQLVLTLEHLA